MKRDWSFRAEMLPLSAHECKGAQMTLPDVDYVNPLQRAEKAFVQIYPLLADRKSREALIRLMEVQRELTLVADWILKERAK